MAEHPVPSPARFARPTPPAPTASPTQHGSASEQPTLDGPPVTGHRLIDAALNQYIHTPGDGAAEQAANLSSVHDVLSTVLEQSRSGQGTGVQTPIPGLREGHAR